MKQLHRLRTRILFAFVAAGAVLGPLIATALLFLSDELLEWNAEQGVRERLEAAVTRPGAFSFQSPEAARGARVLTSAPIHHVPTALFELPDGIHEHETGAAGWLAAIETTPQGRIIVVDDIAALEQREANAWVYVLAGTGLIIIGSLVAGLVVASRVTRPIENLAEAVGRAGRDESVGERFADGLPNDEVRTLAEALDRYRERTHRAIERERRFSADVSHELRNPLAVIRNAAELIGADETLSARSSRALARIELASGRMKETITTLLELMLERGDGAGQARVAVAERVEVMLEQEFNAVGREAEGVRVRWQLEDRPAIAAPRAVVDVICANLIRNVLQHAGARTLLVTIRARSLVIADDGIGMSVQSDRSTGSDGTPGGSPSTSSGTGLGLSLIRRLCGHFDWRIEIDSAPGQGTRVTWWFDPA